MNKISCNICLDLIPLVKDGIASKDSENLVLGHISECNSCREIYDNYSPIPNNKSDDKRIRKNIKKNILFAVITLLLLGFSWAIILSNSMNMFYNSLIMPTIGIFAYILLNKKAYLSAITILISSFIFDFIKCWNDTISIISFKEKFFNSAMNGIFYGVIYTFFCIIGILIGFCFTYVFEKENLYEK